MFFIAGLLQRLGSVNRRMRFVEDTLRIGAVELIHLLALILPLGGILVILGHVSLGDQYNVFSTPLGAGLRLMEFGFLGAPSIGTLPMRGVQPLPRPSLSSPESGPDGVYSNRHR